MARAKNTSRAESRRRARAAQRQQREAAELTLADEQAPAEQAEPTQRPPLFRRPRFREDLRLLPQIVLSRRIMILPPLILIVGAALFAWLVYQPPAAPAEGIDVRSLADLYVQLLFVPPALLTYFLAGFIAPRASYLIGLLLGVLATVLWVMLIYGVGYFYGPEGAVAIPDDAKPVVAAQYALVSIGWGTLGAAFAAWYRDFLRRMQEQGRVRRAEREAKERARRREQRHEDRRGAKRP